MSICVHYIGVDPGASGGIAALSHDGAIHEAVSTPESYRDILDLLRSFGSPSRAMLERVSASPQMGVVSAFKFGKGYGALVMALVAADISFDYVSPQKWQTELGCRTGGGKIGERDNTAAKNKTKNRAQELFPQLLDGVKITHYTADALLIAEYCRRMNANRLFLPASAE